MVAGVQGMAVTFYIYVVFRLIRDNNFIGPCLWIGSILFNLIFSENICSRILRLTTSSLYFLKYSLSCTKLYNTSVYDSILYLFQ